MLTKLCIILSLQTLWIPFYNSQKLQDSRRTGSYIQRTAVDRPRPPAQYSATSVRYKPNVALRRATNGWPRTSQGTHNINTVPKLVYPGRHNYRGIPRYPIYKSSRYNGRPANQERYRQAFRSRLPSSPGYVPSYRPRGSSLLNRKFLDTRRQPNGQRWVHSYALRQPTRSDRWGPWGAWSACSRSCDGGVRTRTRTCQSGHRAMEVSLHRTSAGASYQGNCPGSPHDFQPCSTQLCSSKKSFKDQKYESRLIQCREYNTKNYLGKTYDWVPYIRATLQECRLYCMARGHRMFVELANQVKDGTPCGSDGTQACYHGECGKHRPKVASPQATRPVKAGVTRALEGPEKRLHYKRKPEVRFVKKVIHGVFNTTSALKVGYNSIFKVPIGATDIFIAEVKASRNYLALKVGGKYVINGGWQIDLSKEVKTAGTVVRYKISPGQYSTESFAVKGPVLRELDVQLLYQEENPLIVYNYTTKVPDVKESDNRRVAHAPSYRAEAQTSQGSYQWRVNGITQCSASCGGGEQEYIHRCSTLRPDGSPEIVADYLCGHSRPPKSKRMCNMRPCPSRWVTLPWKPCTKTCGRGGIQLRDIRCRKVTKRNGKDTEINVPISQCDPRTRPELQRQCRYQPCYRQWKTKEWSQCSKSCNKGQQSRAVHCVTEEGFQLPLGECNPAEKPKQTRVCNKQACSSTWFTSSWSECSTECGVGVQRRIVYCAGVGGSAVPNHKCYSEERPSESRKCQVGNCRGVWLTSNWTKCSSVCGPGVRSRVVICAAVSEGKFQEVPSSDCNPEVRPDAKQKCSRGPCSETVWFMTPWTKCSVECGMGVQRRTVTCMTTDGHAGRGCQLEKKPLEEQSCQSKNCRRVEPKESIKQSNSHRSKQNSFKRVESEVLTASLVTSTPQINDPRDAQKTSAEYRASHRVNENSSRKQGQRQSNGHVELRTIGPNHVQESKVLETGKATSTTTELVTTTAPTTKFTTKVPTTSAPTTKFTTKMPTTSAPSTSVRTPNTRPQNPKCKDQKSGHYCKVIIRLQFCKFVVYRRRCCNSCNKQGRS